MAGYNTQKDLEELQRRIRLGDHAISLADNAWRYRRSALERGLQADISSNQARPALHRYVEHRDRYLNVARYCDEAREILSRYKAEDSGGDPGSQEYPHNKQNNGSHKLFALDPHIIRAYAEFWNEKGHRGFEFLKEEFKNSTDDRNNYRLFVYNHILMSGKNIFLDAARPDISEMVAFFFDEKPTDPNKTPIDLKHLLDDIERLAASSAFERSTANRLDYIHKGAVDLASVKAGAVGRQKLALARLNHVLRGGQFYLPEGLVKEVFGHDVGTDASRKIERFSELVRATRRSPAFANDSHVALNRAYRQFREATEYVTHEGDDNRKRLLRGGETKDLALIHELNVLNRGLRICEIDAEIIYVTLSTRIFDFLSAFGKNDILAPMIHPRTALIYQENQLARKQSQALETALASPIAFGRGIPNDGRIRPGEIDDFEATMSEALSATREAFSYSVVSEREGIDQFLKVFDEIFRDSPEQDIRDRYKGARNALQKNLPEIVDRIGAIYSEAAEKDLFENAFDAYQKFSSPSLSDQYVAIRKYSSPTGSSRYTAIPLTRGYRYIFFLHNKYLDSVLGQKIGTNTVRVSMDALLNKVREAADAELRDSPSGERAREIASAEQCFVRACYAASNGEWNLVQSMANRGLRNLALPLDPTEVTTSSDARGYLLAQELYFLGHLAERALAESTANAGVHGSRLLRAASALHKSSKISATLGRDFAPFETPYSPMSIRDALAAVGLLIEWQMKDVWRQSTARDRDLTEILAETDDPRVAWFGLDVLANGLSRGDQKNLAKLVNAAEELLQRAKLCLDAVNSLAAPSHSKEMWGYIVLRAYGMLMTARQANDVLGQTVYKGLSNDKIDEIVKLRDEHHLFLKGCKIIEAPAESAPLDIKKEPLDQTMHLNPFLQGLLAVEAFVAAAPKRGKGRHIADLPAALRAFAAIDENCSSLYRFGFPRMFLRKSKEQFVGPIMENLRSSYLPSDENPDDI